MILQSIGNRNKKNQVMKKYCDKTTGLYFEYPDEWSLEKDENVLSLYDPIDGVGAIQFSMYKVPNDKNLGLKQELDEYLTDNGYVNFEIKKGNSFVYTHVSQENKYWQYWMFIKDDYLIFVSYNCQIDDSSKEIEEINNIVDSALP